MDNSEQNAKQSNGTQFKNDYPSQVYPENYRPPEYLEYLEKAAGAIKTLRIIVYAGLGSFILLAAYGFFLIYQLTSDTHRMTEQAVRMTEQMQAIVRIMSNMHESVADMRASVTDMRGSIVDMNRTMATMSNTTAQMANTVALMQHSVRNLDQSVGPTAGAINSFMPFGWGGNSYRGAPPYAPPVMR